MSRYRRVWGSIELRGRSVRVRCPGGAWYTLPLGSTIDDANRWGFGGAVIDWYCGRCDLRFGWTALDDTSTDQQARVQAALRALGVPAVGVDVQEGQAS